MEENITGGIPTPTAEQGQEQVENPIQQTADNKNVEETVSIPEEKRFTQDEVNKIVSGRVKEVTEKSLGELYKEFGLESKEQLKSIIENSKKVGDYEKTIGEQDTKLKEYEFVDACNANKVKADCIEIGRASCRERV